MGRPRWQDESDNSESGERTVGATLVRSERVDAGFCALKDAKHKLDNLKDARRVRLVVWYVYDKCEG